jgi:transposase-like protein
MQGTPSTLIGVVQHFSNKRTCIEFVKNLHWPNGVTCPVCASKEVTELRTRQLWQCRDCRKQFSVKVGTIFEDSALPLQKWLVALWLITNAKNGISSYEIHRSLGVTQKTAWFMSHRIRLAMERGTILLSGVVEVDESYIGGSDKNRHEGKKRRMNPQGPSDKTIVVGMVERGGDVIAKSVSSAKARNLRPLIRKYVAPNAILYSDNFASYDNLQSEYYRGVINHAQGQYVKGDIHTNTIEGFWNLFKRCLKGTHIHLSPQHLDRYLTEECFRYNQREQKDGGRFVQATSQVFGKRLTYKELIGKD